MKKLTTLSILLLAIVCAYSPLMSQGITAPRPASPASKTTQTVGISQVSVSYSRPSVKGREVWGKLVPYGWNVQGFGAGREAPWRAGANENTFIELSHNATVEGRPVPAGTYALFFVINQDNTGEVILSKEYRSWGSFWYDPAQDLMRAPIKLRDIAHTETLTFDFINMNNNSAELVLNWEKKQFPVSIKFAVDELVIANAKQELKGSTGFSAQGYASAAAYTLQNKIEMEQGLEWIDQALNREKKFGMLMTKAGLLEQTGKAVDSEKIKKEALVIATEPELNNYGYLLLGQSSHDKAIDIFKLATERFPKSANAWDSLGEAYALKGDSKNAITSFKKSLMMNPAENVKANSEKYLKQLGAM